MTPTDKAQLREELKRILDPEHARWLSNSGANDDAIESMYTQIERLFTTHLQAIRTAVEAEIQQKKRVIGDYNDGGDSNYRNRRDAVDSAFNEGLNQCKATLAKGMGGMTK